MKRHLRKLIYIPLFIVTIYTAHFAVDLFLPTITTQDHLDQAQVYLAANGLPQPDIPFMADGCTLFPDKLLGHDFGEICLTHDIAYWAGGSGQRQKEVNLAFKEAITHTGPLGSVLSPMMYIGVAYFGDNGVSRTVGSQWGFGWNEAADIPNL